MTVSRVLGFACCLLALSLGAQTNATKTLEQLRARLDQHVAQPKFQAGTLGVKIVSAKTGAVVYEHDAGELLSPASNAKLYTVALALDRFGTDYTIKTSLYAKEKPVDGRIRGDLILYGRGDPTINARIHGSLAAALHPLVGILTNAGVHEIEGDLIADASFIRGPEFGSGWNWDDADFYYGAEISSLTINDNLVSLAIKPGSAAGQPCTLALDPPTGSVVLSNRTTTTAAGGKRTTHLYRPSQGSVVYVLGEMPADDKGYSEDVTVRDPAGLFLELFGNELRKAGIKVQGQPRVVNWIDREIDPFSTTNAVLLGQMTSLPLKDIAREIQKPSQNLYTDLLLAHVGESSRPASGPRSDNTSEELGIAELQKFLASAGIRKGEVIYEEGSGLSRNNLNTPNATVALLLHMSRHPAAQAYWDALPVAGVDGTLRNRMTNTPAARNVRAKTGTLRWASSLSGDVKTAAGERLIFSVMLNRYYNQDPSLSTRDEVELIPLILAEFSGKVDQ